MEEEEEVPGGEAGVEEVGTGGRKSGHSGSVGSCAVRACEGGMSVVEGAEEEGREEKEGEHSISSHDWVYTAFHHVLTCCVLVLGDFGDLSTRPR